MKKSLIKNDILREICKGDVVSGGLLASKLGVSRTAVWKAVNALRAEGYFISGLGGGYVLSPKNTRLCSEQLKHDIKGANLVFKEKTVSTNEDVKQLAELGDGEFTVVLARSQTGGKGRMGRSFYSGDGGLYFSVLLRPGFSADTCLKITTAAAVAMAKAIEDISQKQTKIKWVNDIFIKGKKVCGILTEGAFDAENGKLKYAVLGIGVNVAAPKDGFPSEIAETADSLFEAYEVSSLVYSALLNSFLEDFKGYYENIESMPHIEEYRKRSFLNGKTVTYERAGKTHTGVVCGIGDNAELIVKEKSKEISLLSGEVRVKDYE
ncbi:MAG: biotin--[Clostridia bacterium]|nr:biotin--[acetyl-CoA-carboxylase] ligase [Clostridia bacterium]